MCFGIGLVKGAESSTGIKILDKNVSPDQTSAHGRLLPYGIAKGELPLCTT